MNLQRSAGNQAVRRLLGSPYIQAKLKVSAPGDPFEREADRVADTVMRMPEPAAQVAPVAPAYVGALRAGGGSPLPPATRAFFEPRFGADFGHVRVHTDARAADAARSIDAKAFSVGQDIVFREGQYAPESPAGRRLLAHELTHVVQQSGNGLNAAGRQQISRAEASVQRDLWDDVEEGLESVGEAVEAGAEWVEEMVAGGAQAVAEGIESGAETVSDFVEQAEQQVDAAVASATEASEEVLGASIDWNNLQLDWDSGPGRTLKAWASQLDSEVVRNVRNQSAATLYNFVAVPSHIQQAAAELAELSVMEFRPGLVPGPQPVAPPVVEPVPVPARPPGGVPIPPFVIAIIIFLVILLIPENIFDDEDFEEKKLKEDREREAKKREEHENPPEPEEDEEDDEEGCDIKHPDLELCGDLEIPPQNFTTRGPSQDAAHDSLKAELRRRRQGSTLTFTNEKAPGEEPPCFEQGLHTNVFNLSLRKNRNIGSIVCCPCCQPTADEPLVEGRCKFIPKSGT